MSLCQVRRWNAKGSIGSIRLRQQVLPGVPHSMHASNSIQAAHSLNVGRSQDLEHHGLQCRYGFNMRSDRRLVLTSGIRKEGRCGCKKMSMRPRPRYAVGTRPTSIVYEATGPRIRGLSLNAANVGVSSEEQSHSLRPAQCMLRASKRTNGILKALHLPTLRVFCTI